MVMILLRHASRLDGHLDHAFRAIAEEVIGVLDLIEREGVRQQRCKIDAPVPDHFHQAPHSLLAAGTQGSDDAIISEPGRESFVRNLHLARTAKAGRTNTRGTGRKA
jgi:hypothetical protein